MNVHFSMNARFDIRTLVCVGIYCVHVGAGGVCMCLWTPVHMVLCALCSHTSVQVWDMRMCASTCVMCVSVCMCLQVAALLSFFCVHARM